MLQNPKIQKHLPKGDLSFQSHPQRNPITILLFMGLIFSLPLPVQANFFPLQFESTHLDWKNESREMIMQGDARIFGKGVGIEAERIRIRFLSQEMKKDFSEKNIESLEADGKVHLHYQAIRTKGEKTPPENQDPQLLIEDNPAEFMDPDIRVTGDHVLYRHSLQHMRVEGSAARPTTLHYYQRETEKNGENQNPIKATSLEQQWDMMAQTLILKGDVHITQEDMELKADQVTFRYHEATQPPGEEKPKDLPIALESVIAEGRVQLSHPDGKASGEKAVFLGADDTITITGKPAHMERQGHTLQGSAIQMNRKTGEMKISGGVSGTLLQEKGKPPSMPF